MHAAQGHLVQALKGEVQSLRSERNGLIDRVSALEDLLAEATEHLSAWAPDIERMRSRIAAMETELVSSRQAHAMEVDALTAQVSEARTRGGAADTEARRLQAELGTAAARAADLQQQADASAVQCSAATKSAADARRQVAALNTQLQALTAERDAAKHRADDVQRQLTDAAADADAARTAEVSSRAELDAAVSHLAGLQEVLAEKEQVCEMCVCA